MPEPPFTAPGLWASLPFGALLAAIALAPLFFPSWWSRHYPKVAFGLGTLTVAYYGWGLSAWSHVVHTGHEYVSFIALIGSLYVIAGGIHITVKGEATPSANCLFLGIGAIAANLFGTTGASMLLIRPWLRLNKYRVTGHHVVFFILIVSNVGGCLTPIGDPPLFLGYLRGVPFWWVATHCWPIWVTGVAVLVAMFYIVDLRNYHRAPREIRRQHAESPDRWVCKGARNLIFLGITLGAVFLERPPFLRELIMVASAAAAYLTTSQEVHEANDFNFHPIREVAILFAGIFATMMPALDWLQANSSLLGAPTVSMYYWLSGSLSSVLDNAPTYLSFLSAALGSMVDPQLADQVQAALATAASGSGAAPPDAVASMVAFLREHLPAATANGTVSRNQIELACLLGHPDLARFIVAISVGSVFFGANTYIGNGPNFMVKAIAEQQRVDTPTFLGYIVRYTLPVMLPMLAVVWLLFFRS